LGTGIARLMVQWFSQIPLKPLVLGVPHSTDFKTHIIRKVMDLEGLLFFVKFDIIFHEINNFLI